MDFEHHKKCLNEDLKLTGPVVTNNSVNRFLLDLECISNTPNTTTYHRIAKMRLLISRARRELEKQKIYK